MVDGETELEHGVVSEFGYSLLDDSKSQILLEDGWIEPRKKGIQDLYFWGYGHDYKEAFMTFTISVESLPCCPDMHWETGGVVTINTQKTVIWS